MKAAQFDYKLAKSIEQVIQLLAEGSGDSIVLAGGQTLVPMLAMRLARPRTVIDINDIAELAGIESTDSEVVIKACTRQSYALASPVIQKRVPLLAKALHFVGHTQTQNRGTIGGSLANADPVAEIPLVALTLNAEVLLQNTSNQRRVPIFKFLKGPMMTTMRPDELLVSLHFPNPQSTFRIGTGFHEINERHGDFAIVAVAARIELDTSGICRNVAVAFGGVDSYPIRISTLEDCLLEKAVDQSTTEAALAELPNNIQPTTDQHATREYRIRVARALAKRAILDATREANGSAG